MTRSNIPWWLTLCLVTVIAASAVLAPLLGAAVVGAAVISLGLAWSPGVILYVAIGFTLLQDAVLHLPPPLSSLDLLDEVLVTALVVVWLGGRTLRHIGSRPIPFVIPLCAFLLVGAISWMVNRTAPVVAAAISPRDYVFQLLLLYLLIQFVRVGARGDRLVLILYASAGAHVLALTGQWVSHFLTTGSLFLEDLATGLMGPNGAHKLGYFCGLVALVALAGLRNAPTHRRLHGLTLIACCYGLILSSARAAYFALPLAAVLGVVWGVTWRKAVPRMVLTLIIVGIGVWAGQWLIGHLPGYASATIDPVRLARQQLRLDRGGAGRIGFLLFSLELTQTAPLPAIGRGPASYVSKTGIRFGGEMTFDLERAFPAPVESYPSVGITLVEYGWLGIAVLGVLLWQILAVARRTARLQAHGVGWLGKATAGAVFLLVIACLFENALEIQQLTGAVALLVATCWLALRDVADGSGASEQRS